jgi:hypothetical protein
MSKQRRPYIGPSEAQSRANQEALARRSLPFAPENRTSVAMSYDFRRRLPRDLRDAVEQVRRAYADEVPAKLHSGQDLAPDGTPAMTSKAEAYIFGGETWTDAGRGEHPLVSFYLTPFRATLSKMEHASAESTRKRAAIVKHVTIGGQKPEHAAESEGVPSWCSRDVAEQAILSFLRRMSDMKVDVANEVAAA